MAVLRMGEAMRTTAGAVVLDLGDLKRQGEAIRARSQAQAEEIVRDAHREREALIAGAREEGRAEGMRAGREDGMRAGREEGKAAAVAERRAALQALEKSWSDALAEFVRMREHLMIEARSDIVRLALEIAQRVTRRKVDADPGVVGELLGAVLALITRPTRLSVRLHPEDEPLAREVLPALLESLSHVEHVELRPDPSLPKGSCIARTPTGSEIDASVTTQLDRIASALLPEGSA
ncbi:V/A-type H+/Na+-transporting ATPase subunit E [Phycisphaerales bacterium]|nr:V/A-type H+/Na+-transporting ATPase subunit E [Phycisphaerales bacterium]